MPDCSQPSKPDPIDFDDLYRHDPDPFSVATAWYERRKIDLALASLAQPDYGVAWDCACGTGELTASLRSRCGTVVATDASPEAVRLTRQRTGDDPAVHASVNRLPDLPTMPHRPALVVVSEVLYYLDDHARSRVCAALPGIAGGEIVCVNWRHHPRDAYVSGADAVAELDEALTAYGWRRTVRHEEPQFLLWSWQVTQVGAS
ncbi:MAG: class I SAM-dependent DNA methyltransferase [Dermatophilaceae bacterium]